MKQLVPSGLDEYIAEHKPGDVVSGRVVEISGGKGRVELGEGVHATCDMGTPKKPSAKETSATAPAKADLASLGSMLQARWKSGAPAAEARPDAAHAGEILSFRITKLEPEAKKIELELA